MRRFFSFLTGTICGALVGATIAIFLAPSSGDELQQRIRDRVATVKDEVRQAYETRMAQLEAELEALRSGKENA